MSIKWSGVQTLAPAVAALLIFRRVPWHTIFWFALVPVVHLLIWMAGLYLMGHASGPATLWQVLVSSFSGHATAASAANPLASPWYSWPVLYHPIVVKLSSHGITSRYASSLGNPVFWFPASLLVVGLPVTRGLTAWRARWRGAWPPLFDPSFNKAVFVLAVGWAALFVPLGISMGQHAFLYHYQPSYGFAIVLLAGVVAKLEQRWPRAVLVFVALAILMATYLAPVWGEFPLTEQEANRRLIFLPWRP